MNIFTIIIMSGTRTLLSSLLVVLVIFSTACSSSKSVSSSVKTAKEITVKKDKALVYIMRPSVYGILSKLRVDCDGESMGKTFGREFLYTYVNPGEHTFYAQSENDEEITLTLEPGKAYYIQQQIYPGLLTANVELEPITDQAEALEMLGKCSLAKNNLKK